MYKFEIIANEIGKHLEVCREQGMESATISVLDIDHQFEVPNWYGAKLGTRYPLIYQTMHNVFHYGSYAREGADPRSTFTATYNLKPQRSLT